MIASIKALGNETADRVVEDAQQFVPLWECSQKIPHSSQ